MVKISVLIVIPLFLLLFHLNINPYEYFQQKIYLEIYCRAQSKTRTFQIYNLDEHQKITPKMKHQKKRSIPLAQIGYYQNNDIRRMMNEIIQKPKRKITKSQKSNQNNEKNESEKVEDQTDINEESNNFMNYMMKSEDEMDFIDINFIDSAENDFFYNM